MGDQQSVLLVRWYQLSHALANAQDELERARAGSAGEQACAALQLRIDRLAHDLHRAQEDVEAARADRPS